MATMRRAPDIRANPCRRGRVIVFAFEDRRGSSHRSIKWPTGGCRGRRAVSQRRGSWTGTIPKAPSGQAASGQLRHLVTLQRPAEQTCIPRHARLRGFCMEVVTRRGRGLCGSALFVQLPVASAACSQIVGPRRASAGAKFSTQTFTGSLQPGGRRPAAPAESLWYPAYRRAQPVWPYRRRRS